jgi:hypothetical protein
MQSELLKPPLWKTLGWLPSRLRENNETYHRDTNCENDASYA